MSDFSPPQPAAFIDDVTAQRTITTSERHRLLSAERRRVALRVFDEQPLPMDLAALAGAVTRRESGAVSADSVRISLHHRHLPLMADIGVIDYDPVTHRISAP